MTIQLPDFLSAIEVNIQLANCSAIRLLLAIRLPDNRMPTVFSFFKCDAIFPGGTPGPAQLWRLGWLASTKPQISDAWNWMSSLQVPCHFINIIMILHLSLPANCILLLHAMKIFQALISCACLFDPCFIRDTTEHPNLNNMHSLNFFHWKKSRA